MRASICKATLLILAVAVVASGQTIAPISRVMPINPGEALIQNDDANETTPVTTTRDAQGVWHIEGGDTIYDVYRAMGYAVASDRLFQMELYKRQGRGTLSEVLGESYLSTSLLY